MEQAGRMLPMDALNQQLVHNVHPDEWQNPTPAPRYNLVVIGAGTAGLVSAAGAAGLGAKVAIIEKHLMGGDCLNVGCVPSKCVIRSSRVIGELRDAARLGVHVAPATVDFAAVMERMRAIRAHISDDDSVWRFRDQLGVDVFLGEASFSGPDTIAVGGQTLRFKRAVIATGARAAVPPIPGLTEVGYLTNETVFTLTQRPPRLAVIGGGPIGCELAQAFARLGCSVTLLTDTGHLLNREDADAAAIIQNAFVRDGITLKFNSEIRRAHRDGDAKVVTFAVNGREETVTVDEILIGAGRAPNVEGLNLEAAGIAYDMQRGVTVNDQLQTTNLNVYAAGDICMAYKFTHAADAAARIVIQNALFFGRKKLSALTMPWCTYTDPEVAHVGLYEHDAKERGIEVHTFVRELNAVHRALADGETEGFVKVHIRKGSDTIVGATIVARHAGEMINELSLAIVAGIGLGTIANVIHSYPTQAEAIKQVADAYNRTRLTPLVKQVFRTYLGWIR